MALSGTLSDFGIVDLIQFPGKGRRTGEMVLNRDGAEIRLYYAEGSLVHAVSGDVSGMDALVETVSWEEGDFEFHTGVETDARTLDMDLHRALMAALKVRDERMEAMRMSARRTKSAPPTENKAVQLLNRIIKKESYLQGICLMKPDGTPVIEAEAEETEEGRLAQIREALGTLYKEYRDGGLSRAFLEDDAGVVHGIRIGTRGIAVIVADRETSMGKLSLAMNRLVTALEETEA